MMSHNGHTAPAPGGPPAAWRLLCAYDRTGAVRVVSRRRIQKVVPPSEPLDPTRRQAAFWLEVRDAQEQPQYVRAMRNPIPEYAEVPPPPGGGRFSNVPAAGREGAFALLVPDLPGGDHVSLLQRAPGRPGSAGARSAGPAEVARLPLGGPERAAGEGAGRPEEEAR
jgi:hypothetical protein